MVSFEFWAGITLTTCYGEHHKTTDSTLFWCVFQHQSLLLVCSLTHPNTAP